MRSNVQRVETRTSQGRVVCQSGGVTHLSVVRVTDKQPAKAERDPVTSNMVIIHDEHLRDQLEKVLGFRPYSFGR